MMEIRFTGGPTTPHTEVSAQHSGVSAQLGPLEGQSTSRYDLLCLTESFRAVMLLQKSLCGTNHLLCLWNCQSVRSKPLIKIMAAALDNPQLVLCELDHPP